MRVLKACGGVLVLSLWATVSPRVSAEVFVCVQPGGLEVYRDYGGPGCRIIEEKPARPAPPTHALTTPAAPQGQIEMPSLPPAAHEQTAQSKDPGAKSKPELSHKAFRAVRMSVPGIAYYGGHGSNWYVPKAGEVTFQTIIVRHLADGKGPKIVTDNRFGRYAGQALYDAILIAARSVGYDSAYLEVEFDLSLPAITHLGMVPVRISGDSGSGMWAVAIAAALLGDAMRPDVCMTGAIEPDGKIGFVGKVDQKVYGCAKDRFREMVVPFGQKDMELLSNAMSVGVTVTEVRTLAEAYEVVTGKILRQFTER